MPVFKQTPNYNKKGNRSARKSKGKRATTKRATTTLIKQGSNRTGLAPVNVGVQHRGGYGLSFGAAPFEETLGAGIRIQASMMSGPVVRQAFATGAVNRVFTGYEGTSSALCTGLRSSFGTATGSGYDHFPIWNNSLLDSPLHVFMSLFAKYNVRHMVARWVPDLATNISGSIAYGISFDDGGIIEEASYTDISALTKSSRTPYWMKDSLTCIADRDLRSPAMRLFDTGVGSDKQFTFIAAVSSLPETADSIGHFEFDFVIDLYQFKKKSTLAALRTETKETCPVPLVRKKADETVLKVQEEDYVLTPASSASSSSVTSSIAKPLVGKVSRAQTLLV